MYFTHTVQQELAFHYIYALTLHVTDLEKKVYSFAEL